MVLITLCAGLCKVRDLFVGPEDWEEASQLLEGPLQLIEFQLLTEGEGGTHLSSEAMLGQLGPAAWLSVFQFWPAA